MPIEIRGLIGINRPNDETKKDAIGTNIAIDITL